MVSAARREREVRSLAARGRSVYGTAELAEPRMYVTASVLPSGNQFLVQVDFYRAVGAFGDSVREESRSFEDADEALDYLTAVTGIPISELKVSGGV
jgi:hypothetical protein